MQSSAVPLVSLRIVGATIAKSLEEHGNRVEALPASDFPVCLLTLGAAPSEMASCLAATVRMYLV